MRVYRTGADILPCIRSLTTARDCVLVHPEQFNERPTLARVLLPVERKQKVTYFYSQSHMGACGHMTDTKGLKNANNT